MQYNPSAVPSNTLMLVSYQVEIELSYLVESITTSNSTGQAIVSIPLVRLALQQFNLLALYCGRAKQIQ